MVLVAPVIDTTYTVDYEIYENHVILNEVKNLIASQRGFREMFRCAQHDNMPTAF